MEIKVVYTLKQAEEAISWFLQGDLSVIALDTETMGKKWFELQKQFKHMAKPDRTAPKEERKRYKELEGEIKSCANNALYPTKNYLATLQLSSSDERVMICVLRQSAVLEIIRRFVEQLMNLTSLWLIQNAKFDLKQLQHHLNFNPAEMSVWDTMLTEILINGNRNNDSASLKFLSAKYATGSGMEKGSAAVSVSDWWTNLLTDEQINYAAMDVLLLHHIYKEQQKAVNNLQLNRVHKLEHHLTPALVSIEKVGIQYDKPALDAFITRASQKFAELETIFRDSFSQLNYNSEEQMLPAIVAQYGVTPTVSKWDPATNAVVTVPSVDKFALLESGLRGIPAIDAYVALKELGKNIATANAWLKADARFMTEYIQLKGATGDRGDSGGTRTGRMSSKPNLQNQSNFMKQFLIADEGWVILSADYSGIEMRLMASYANEGVLKQMFIDGLDPHNCMAQWAFGLDKVDKKSVERRIAKEINFGFLYGMYGRKFCSRVLRQTNGEVRLSEAEGRRFRDEFFRRYPAIEYWHKCQFAQACVDGYVTTRSGRRRYYNPSARPSDVDSFGFIFHPIQQSWFQSYYASDWKWRNIAYNTPIQGTGGDGIKQALININRQWADTPDRRVFATVHDSIDAFVRVDSLNDAAIELERAMIDGMQIYLPDVPVEVELTYGKSWANPPNEHKSKFYKSDEDSNLWTQAHFQTAIDTSRSSLLV